MVFEWLAKEDMESVWRDFPLDSGYCFGNLDEVGHWTPKVLGRNWSLDIQLCYFHSCESLRTRGGKVREYQCLKTVCNHHLEVKDRQLPIHHQFTDKPHPMLGQFLTLHLATHKVVCALPSNSQLALVKSVNPISSQRNLTRIKLNLNILIVDRKLL